VNRLQSRSNKVPDKLLEYLRRTSRRILLRRLVENAVVGAIVGGLLAAGCQFALWSIGIPHRITGASVVLASMLIGVLAAVIRGVSMRQAARYVDNLAALDERLTTAVQLARAGDRSPAAMCVYAQAGRAARSDRAAGVNLWIRGRVTVGAAILALFLCGAAAMLPQRRGVNEQVIDALAGMSPEAVKALAAEFARAAQATESDSPLLARAAKATEHKDARVLASVLADLERRGVKLVRILRPEVLALATSGGSDASGGAETQPAISKSPSPIRVAGGVVHVWDPIYDKLGSGRSPAAKTPAPAVPQAAVRYSDAWSAARLRASESLRTGSIPHEYRAMVRDFFSDRQ